MRQHSFVLEVQTGLQNLHLCGVFCFLQFSLCNIVREATSILLDGSHLELNRKCI
jgi:hypothetical protein